MLDLIAMKQKFQRSQKNTEVFKWMVEKATNIKLGYCNLKSARETIENADRKLHDEYSRAENIYFEQNPDLDFRDK